MMYVNYGDICASIMRFCADIGYQLNIEAENVFNFDSIHDLQRSPSADCIGYAGLEVKPDGDSDCFHVNVMIGFTVVNDINLHHLNIELMSELMLRLIPNGRIPLFDSGNGAYVGVLLATNDYAILPERGQDGRSIKLAHFHFLSDCGLNAPTQKPQHI